MDIVKGFPSTMQDDYQLNISNLIKHAVRNADKQEIVCKVGDSMFRHTYADAYGRMMRFANALKGLGIGIGGPDRRYGLELLPEL